jgi:hypothetical protein
LCCARGWIGQRHRTPGVAAKRDRNVAGENASDVKRHAGNLHGKIDQRMQAYEQKQRQARRGSKSIAPALAPAAQERADQQGAEHGRHDDEGQPEAESAF